MKAKYLILISLLLLFTIGSVSATDNTISDNVTEDQNIEVITSIQPVILGNSSNSTQTYCISDDNYDDYFNSTTGGFLSNSTIKDGDILKIANVSNKLFTISKSLTVTSNSSTNVIFNSSFKLVTGSDNTIVSNLTIRNTDSSLPILLENVSNIIISKNNIFVSGDSNSTIANGILGEAINNLNIIGNVITVNGKNQTSSIRIIDSGNISFVSNNITTIGPDFAAKFTPSWEAIYNTIGVFIDNSCNVLFDKNFIDTSYNEFENGGSILGTHINKCNNLTILSNIFKTNGTGYVYTLCIEGVYNSSDNGHLIEISDNNVSAYSKTYGNALKLSNFRMANVNNNEFYAYAENFTYPVYIEEYFNTSNGTIVNNTMTEK